uniref:Uncharacterized protein n=1 Tax=Panagrolaimus superbus TaxID=310955 RepID=A0A914ZDC9_9BILA
MHKGRFVEAGTHHELLERKGGVYAKLVAAQELHNLNIDKKDDGEHVEEELLSPDQPNAALTIASKTVRESIRESFMRDFLPSDHLGDAQTEAYDVSSTDLIALHQSGQLRRMVNSCSRKAAAVAAVAVAATV